MELTIYTKAHEDYVYAYAYDTWGEVGELKVLGANHGRAAYALTRALGLNPRKGDRLRFYTELDKGTRQYWRVNHSDDVAVLLFR